MAQEFENIARMHGHFSDQHQSVNNLSARARTIGGAVENLSSIAPQIEAKYLVKNWLDQRGLSVVYGESNVGKSFFALDLAMHIAGPQTDTGWHGSRIRAGRVLYLAAEGGHGIRNRLAAMRQAMPHMTRYAEEEGSFCLLPMPLDLQAIGDAQALVEVVEGLSDAGVDLIVVDTLARTMGSGDENTAKDMGTFIQNIDHIRERLRAHVMVIHHSGKDASKGARGSGSLRAAVDTEIELTRSGAVIMAEVKKQRDGETGKVFAYSLKTVELGADEDGDPVTSAIVVPTEPVKKAPRLSGQQKIALQALADVMAEHGEVKHSSGKFPSNRQCVPLDKWREYCDRHSLSGGASDSAKRKAFFAVKTALHNKGIVRVVDDFVWRCGE